MDDNKIREERIIVDTSLLAQIYICALSKNGYTYENSKAFRQVFEDFLAILSDPEEVAHIRRGMAERGYDQPISPYLS